MEKYVLVHSLRGFLVLWSCCFEAMKAQHIILAGVCRSYSGRGDEAVERGQGKGHGLRIPFKALPSMTCLVEKLHT